MDFIELPVEPLLELRPADVNARIPDGGLCNAGLCKIDGGWIMLARNNSTPGRRPAIGGKYQNFLHTIWLTEDFKLAAHEPSQIVCADFKGCPQDVRMAPSGDRITLSGCYRPNMGSHFKMALGVMDKAGTQMSFVQAPTAPALGNGDQKNWAPLADSIYDIGWCERGKEHLCMVFKGPDSPNIGAITTPLQGNHKPRPSAPGFEFLGRKYMSYHSHVSSFVSYSGRVTTRHDRMYFQQFARLREECVDIQSSTPPMRFSHGAEHGIQFLTGAVVQDSNLIVSYGVNDEYNVVGRVKLEDILKHIL